MVLRLLVTVCLFSSLFKLAQAQCDFGNLEKPFTGSMEVAWESMASRNCEAQLRRSRSAASASLAAHRSLNATANYTLTGSIPRTTPFPVTASPSSYSVAPKCNASLQNSYHRMVTDIEEYTLTNGAVQTAVLDDHDSYTTFTLTGPTTYTTIYTRALRPGRPWQAYYPDNYQCCMDCYVYFPQVEVYYWPVPESEEVCANSSESLVTAQAVLPSGAAKTAAARINTLFSNSSLTGPVTTVNADGFTFVSPSVYVAFGDVSAGDACGAVGQKHTSVTLGFAPGELQTVTALGKNHYETALGTRAFDPKNVLCPPDFKPDSLFVQQDSLAGIHTYRPRIQIPPALQNLDPKWSSCVVDDYEGIDPPRQLVPASGWGDSPAVTTSIAPVQQPTPAPVVPPLPKNTAGGSTSGSGDPPSNPNNHPPNPDPNSNQDTPAGTPGSAPGQGPPEVDPSSGSGGAGARPGSGTGSQQQPNPQPPAAQNPSGPNVGQPAVVVQGQTVQQGGPAVTIGGKPVVYSQGSVYVNGVAAPAPTISHIPPPGQKANPVTLDGFEFRPTIQPRPQGAAVQPAVAKPAVVVQGQTLMQGASPVTINGNQVAYSGGSVYVGNTAVPIPYANQGQNPPPVAVKGMTFTPVAVAPNRGSQASPVDSGNQARPVVIVKGQTLTENGAPATINGKPVIYSGGAIYAGGTRVSVPTVRPGEPPSPVNVAGLSVTPQPIQSNGNGPVPAVIVAGHTLAEGAPAVSVNGAKIAYSSGSVYVNGKAAPLPTPAPQPAGQADSPVVVGGLSVYPVPPARQQAGIQTPIATVAGHVIVQQPAGAVVIDGTTLVPGGYPTTIAGTVVSLNPTAIMIGGSTIPLVPSPTVQTIATAGGQVISRNAEGVIIVAGSTLMPGGHALTIAGTRFSLGPTALVVGTSTVPLSTSATNAVLTDSAGGIFTLASNGGLIVLPGATISAGGPAVTVSGTPFSLLISGGSTMLIEGTSTIPLFPSITPPPLDIFSSIITADVNGDYVVNGTTITPDGPAITVSGTRISLGHIGRAEILVVGTSTSTVDVTSSGSTRTASQSLQSGAPSTIVEPTGSAGTGGSSVAATASGANRTISPYKFMSYGILILVWLISCWA